MTAVPRFFFLCTIGLCSLLSYNAVRMPVLALFAESLGAGPALVGLVVAASTLTGVALKLPAGALSDLYGRHRIMRLALVAFAVPPFLYPFVTDVEVLIGLRFVHGLATALFAPSALAMVAEMFPAHRGASLGWYTASTQAGALLGPVLGGWLVYLAGFPQTFVAGGLIGCVGLLLFFALGLNRADAPTRRSELTSAWSEFTSGLRSAVRNAPVVVTSLADAAKMIANGALMAFLPLYGLSVGLNPGEVGLLFGAQALTSFVSKPVMGRVSDRIGRPPLILLGLVLCAGTFVLIPHVTAWPVLLILSAGFGFGEAVVSSSSAALVADLSAGQGLGAGLGLQGTVADVGHASGPLLAGVLIALLSYIHAFAVIATIQILAGLVFWVGVKRWQRPA